MAYLFTSLIWKLYCLNCFCKGWNLSIVICNGLIIQAAPLVNSSAAYNRLGVAQTFAGQTAEAQATFARALKLAPGDLDVETNMALAAALEDNSATELQLVQKVAGEPNA